MFTFLLGVHVLVCVILIGIVLVQGGKGAELGSAFGGGSSQTLFGGRGAATFLGKATTIVAVIFMITSLLLAIISVRQSSVSGSSIMNDTEVQTQEAKPQTEEAADKAGVKPEGSAAPAEKPSQ